MAALATLPLPYGCTTAMPDRSSLGIIGFLFCGITAAVVLIGALVVTDHLSGRLSLDSPLRAGVTSSR